MKKLFCIADVHSFYDEMMTALNEAGFDIDNEDHILVHCGDLLDRGPKPLECLNFINSISKYRKILIKGNHEDLLEDILARGYFCMHDEQNRTTDTCAQLSGISKIDMLSHELTLFAALDKVKNMPELKEYYSSLVDYFEVDNYIFVHGWVPIVYSGGMPIYNRLDGYWKDGDWKDARWINGMHEWYLENKSNTKLKDKTIVCGHYHTSWGHSNLHDYGVEFDDEYYEEASPEYRAHFEPFIDDGIIALDSCVAYTGFINCYVIEIEDNRWQ